MSSKYWDIGENYLHWTHFWPNSRLSQKQNVIIDAFTMVQQSSYRHIQAVMNNLHLIILDYLAAKKSWALDWRRCFWLVQKQSLYLECNALQTSYRVQYTQGQCSTQAHSQQSALINRMKLWCGGVPWALCST